MSTLTTTVQNRPTGSRPSTAPDSTSVITASELWSMLRRRMVLCVFLFVLFSGLGVGGFVVWWVYFPGYLSESLVECISNIPETDLSLVEQQRLRQDEHERFVRTQALLVTSPKILGEALKITEVRETKWYKDVLRRNKEPLLELKDQLFAGPVRGTNFLRVAMECREAEDAEKIVNQVVGLWYQTAKKTTAEEFASDSLAAAQKELDDTDRSLTLDRERLKGIAERLPPGAVQNPGANVTAQEVRQYSEQVTVLELEKSQLEQYRALYNNPEAIAVTAEDRAMVEQDPQVAELNRALFLVEQQRAADSKVFGPEHSVLRNLEGQAEALRAKLDQLRLEKLRERKADIREAANTAFENARYALLLAQDKLRKAEDALTDQDRMLFDYLELSTKILTAEEGRLKLSDYVKSLTRVKTQRTAINVNVAQPAIRALERNSPSKLLAPASVCLALALAVSLSIALEWLDKSVRTPQDILRHVGVVMLGTVPDADDEETAIERVETALRDSPRSLMAEAFRGIRTNLQFSSPVDAQRTILVTSPGPEDGKTTIACNLAVVLAQGGRRVLLVDANLRKPRLHTLFEKVPTTGLSNALIGAARLSDIATPSGLQGLDIVGSGPTPPNPAELLGGEPFRAFLQEASKGYDHVILDSAPVLLANDAAVLATLVDGVILTLRANQNSKGVARRASAILADVRAHVFGAVLNAARVTRGGYYREQLRTFYEYQAEGDEAAKA